MHLLRRSLALVLLALWLPATLHCDLEAAGLDDLFHCAVDHHSTAGHSDRSTPASDACDLIESAGFKPAANTAVLLPPALCACLHCLVVLDPATVLTPPVTGVSDRVVAPPEVARTWHFVARAALPSRAPSLVA